MPIKERIEKVKITTTSVSRLEKNTIKLYENVKKIEVVNELLQRSVKFSSSLPQKDLMSLLQYEMHGVQRLPALLYGYPKKSLGYLNLEQYEMLPNEPLHDMSNYIKNIYQEIPAHFSKNEKNKVKEAIENSFNGKEAKNSSDYRKSLLVVCSFFLENSLESYITQLLVTLAEIQELLHSPEKERSIRKILQLHITSLLYMRC